MVLGSEADLLERYQVSRAVFREAVRLLEHQQVARTRRGPGGGLVITEPTIDAVIDTVVLYLHRVDARLDEIFEARIILEELAAQLASERTDEVGVVRVAALRPQRTRSSPHRPARAAPAGGPPAATTPALPLFVDVFNQVAQLYSPDWRRLGSNVEKEASTRTP